MILTTPLIAHLARQGPVDVITTPMGASVLGSDPHVRRLVVFDKRGADRGPAGLWRVARAVHPAQRDATAYLAQGSLRSALLARAAGFPRRIGFDTSPGRVLYTESVPFLRDRHHAERLLRLALGPTSAPLNGQALRPHVYPTAADATAADETLAGIANDGRLRIVLAPGSIWATKRWPYYSDLARALQPQFRVIVVGSSADRPLAEAIVAATQGDAVDATGRLSLLGSAALIGRCHALITNDSAPLHLASAMNTPTVAVFGPTVPAFGFGPLAERRAIAQHEQLDCRPCHPHGPRKCPLGHWRCMRDLAVADVLAQLRRLT